DRGYGVAADSAGNVLLTGYFAGSVNFGGTLPLTSTGPLSAFVAKYSPTGVYSWAQAITSTGANTGYGVAVDSRNNVIVTGSFQGASDFGGTILTSVGSSDSFVVKYLPGGGLAQWAHRYGNTSGDIGYAVTVDNGDNVLATGYFAGTVSFGGAPLTSAG